MGAISVTSPNGIQWTVRRRWVPHREGKGVRERLRRRPDTDGLVDGLDVADGLDDIPVIGAIVLVIAVFVLVLLLAPWFPFVVLLAIDLLWLAVAFVGTLIGRVVLRRPWLVEARSAAGRRQWHVPGFRAAGRRRDEIGGQLQRGQNPLGDAPAPMPH